MPTLVVLSYVEGTRPVKAALRATWDFSCLCWRGQQSFPLYETLILFVIQAGIGGLVNQSDRLAEHIAQMPLHLPFIQHIQGDCHGIYHYSLGPAI